MPHFRLETNVPQDKIPADFSAKLCGVLSKSLGKPINYCCATVIGGVDMSWGGSKDAAAQATLMSIGALGIEKNKKHSKALFECISQNIGVPADSFPEDANKFMKAGQNLLHTYLPVVSIYQNSL